MPYEAYYHSISPRLSHLGQYPSQPMQPPSMLAGLGVASSNSTSLLSLIDNLPPDKMIAQQVFLLVLGLRTQTDTIWERLGSAVSTTIPPDST